MSETDDQDKSGRKMPKGVREGMIKVSGKDYLPVPFRLLWMREEKPLWGISTQILEVAGYTLVRATVTDEAGRVIASAHKALIGGGKFPPVEKAETGAMGRALGAAGFGTQFGELDEEEPGVMGGIADSPVSRTRSNARYEVEEYGSRQGQRPPNVDPDGVVHEGVPSRPPLSAMQQAVNNFKAAAGAIDGVFAAPSFSELAAAAMVKCICEDEEATVEEVRKSVPSWQYATHILREFKHSHPACSASTALMSIQMTHNTKIPMAQFTGTMWQNPFPPAAGNPASGAIRATDMYGVPETVEAR